MRIQPSSVAAAILFNRLYVCDCVFARLLRRFMLIFVIGCNLNLFFFVIIKIIYYIFIIYYISNNVS